MAGVLGYDINAIKNHIFIIFTPFTTLPFVVNKS